MKRYGTEKMKSYTINNRRAKLVGFSLPVLKKWAVRKLYEWFSALIVVFRTVNTRPPRHRKIKDMELLSCCYPTFGSVESVRQEVQRLQKDQMEYGIYAFIPGTQQTYEEVIQSLVGLDLRRQCEERRQRNHKY